MRGQRAIAALETSAIADIVGFFRNRLGYALQDHKYFGGAAAGTAMKNFIRIAAELFVGLVPGSKRNTLAVMLAHSAARRGDAARYAAYRPLRPNQFLNIGAGNFFHPWWTNLDHGTAHYAPAQRHGFVEYNLVAPTPLPFADSSASIAYTSHVIEHVGNDAVDHLFREVHRVLEPGGIFRITCPDADLLYESSRDRNTGYWAWRRGWFAARGMRDVAPEQFLVREIATERTDIRESTSPIRLTTEAIREHLDTLPREAFLDWLTAPCRFAETSPGNHINWWSFDKCRQFLQQAGFATIYRSGYGASRTPVLQDTSLFDNTHPEMSLYVEARKN